MQQEQLSLGVERRWIVTGGFVVPAFDEFVEVFGVGPRRADGADTVYEFEFALDGDDFLGFSYDIVWRSVRVRWLRQEDVLVDVFREGADRLVLEDGGAECGLAVDFRTASLAGQLRVQVFPRVAIRDELLLV
ncbi:hypothetical protein [Allokutzneria oryzae]|uniref:Uncharacterized protein n=1 Tax=Allokutzneria oryzae TaxID=1378989 RepID=A0ABV5ZSN1_9PSEU